jgi:ATP-dependent DNA helicase Rep/DNA helicase-2/ATP-dependent DNA helicase PcrA
MVDLNDLNPQQREAAETVDGPVLVLSGAGTGKTRTITYRIAHMLARGIPPEHILAVTFTNKAAKEMIERVRALVGSKVDTMQVSTFHSLGLRIIRENTKKIGLRKGFSIYTRSDQVAIIKKALRALSISWKKYKPEDILFTMNRMRVPTEEGIEVTSHDDIDAYVLKGVWERYHAALRAANAVDFEDLLLLPLRFLKTHTRDLKKYRDLFRYILVDEYQDTNHIQFEMIHLLAKKQKNLCVVGDDDQSIYGWRGAEIRNILDFEKHFPGALVVRLEENYRSTRTILNAANAVIEKNEERKPKKLWTKHRKSIPIRCLVAPDDMSEAEMVVADLLKHRKSHRRKYSDYAILMRMNTQARQFEDVLRRYQVPYTVVGGMQFYDRKEIKDFLAYLRLLVNPGDEEAFMRVVNVPGRSVGDAALDRIHDLAAARNCSPFECLDTIKNDEVLKPAQRTNLSAFYNMIDSIHKKLKRAKPSECARELWKKIDYQRELQRILRVPEDIANRMENVEVLIEGIAYYERQTRKPTLEGYLREVMLLNNDDDEELTKDKMPLMTIHASKGLEFPCVYLAGAEQGIMPHDKSVVDEKGKAEERRLFYVAITRAKRDLTITYPKARMKFGKLESRKPSEFLADIPEDLIEWHKNAFDREATEEEATDYLKDLKALLAE